jgi:hypothetical protein
MGLKLSASSFVLTAFLSYCKLLEYWWFMCIIMLRSMELCKLATFIVSLLGQIALGRDVYFH